MNPPDRTDLFGKPFVKRAVALELFHDERRIGDSWLYHGLLLVPQERVSAMVQELSKVRERHKYWNEVHFSGLTNAPGRTYGEKAAVARDWVKRFLGDFSTISYFYLLGIDLREIDLERFGYKSADATRSDAEEVLFYRFLEIATYAACRWFFKDYDAVALHGMFKDSSTDKVGPLERVPRKLNYRSWATLRVHLDSMQSVCSDHRKETRCPERSHLIQYLDVLIGSASQVLDNTSRKDGIRAVAAEMVPWVKRAVEQPYNIRSAYYKRYAMSFFPSRRVSAWPEVGDLPLDLFYHARVLHFCHRGQGELFGNLAGK